MSVMLPAVPSSCLMRLSVTWSLPWISLGFSREHLHGIIGAQVTRDIRPQEHYALLRLDIPHWRRYLRGRQQYISRRRRPHYMRYWTCWRLQPNVMTITSTLSNSSHKSLRASWLTKILVQECLPIFLFLHPLDLPPGLTVFLASALLLGIISGPLISAGFAENILQHGDGCVSGLFLSLYRQDAFVSSC